nr:ribonuclease H-like domain-containing protein [Tanacetum cinerariifolium]
MTSLFAESHNMVAILEKSDAAEGFEQIIDFLSGSYINHALTVNPHVFISCIKQFWNTDVVKRTGDVTRLQALVDKKRIVITEEVVREILQLNDAEGVICLPNEEILAGLARMGHEKPSKTNIADLSKHTTRYISPVLTQKVFANMRRVGKEKVTTNVISPIPTSPSPSSPVISSSPPHQSPCPPQPQDAEGSSHFFQQVLDTCSAFAHRVEVLENDKVAQQLEIVKLKAMVKKLEKLNKVKSSKLRRLKKVGTSQRAESSDDVENVFNQGRISVEMDQDEGIELVVDYEKDVEVEGRYADKQAEIYNINLDHSLKVLSMQEDDTKIQEAVEIVTTAKLMTEIVTAAATQEELDKEHEEAYKNIDWNAALDHVQSKEPQFDANMKFLFKSREEMEKEDEDIIKSINETPVQKAAKRRKLSEEAQEADDLRRRLEIVQDEDDDVFVEAIPLAQKSNVDAARLKLKLFKDAAAVAHANVSQMCDKKNNILFTDTECLVLSSDFKLPDASQVLLRVPRENNMYNINLKNIIPSVDLTCLFAKATLDESNLWHRRLGHVNFKTINKLVKGNLVRGLPSKVFTTDLTCVACKKGKQHRASKLDASEGFA